MQSNFWAGSKNLDQHKTFWDLQKDKALDLHHNQAKFCLKYVVSSDDGTKVI